MVATFPKGVYKMTDRMSIISANSGRYCKAGRKLKGKILDELTHILGMNRNYVAYLLRNVGRRVTTPRGS